MQLVINGQSKEFSELSAEAKLSDLIALLGLKNDRVALEQNGEIVSLEIPLPLSPYPLKVRAIVRYRDGLRYGFEFLTLTDPQRETIRRVCEMLAGKAENK